MNGRRSFAVVTSLAFTLTLLSACSGGSAVANCRCGHGSHGRRPLARRGGSAGRAQPFRAAPVSVIARPAEIGTSAVSQARNFLVTSTR